MKRSPIRSMSAKRRAKLHQPTVEREPRPMATFEHAKPLHRGVMAGSVSGQAIDKERPVRSEEYRRLVAALPCACGCGRQPCQAAHPNAGKGMALKTDDRLCFPLAPDCHRAFDQGAMFTREERRAIEPVWGERTRAAILAAGNWPRNLPRWVEA